LSFFVGKKSRGTDYEKIAKYAAGGAGALVAAGYVMAETGRPIGFLAPKTAGDFTGHYGWDQRPVGHEHFHRW